MRARPAHRRVAAESGQEVWIAFGGTAEQPWLWPLRRGFRHCFAALRDPAGWTVLDPLTGRLVTARLPLAAAFDLPDFYKRAGLTVVGPFEPGPPAARLLPPFEPFTCVALCRAVLGADAPFALTPHGLYRALKNLHGTRKKVLTNTCEPV